MREKLTQRENERQERERGKERGMSNLPGGGHVSKHGGAGNPHPQTGHGANHLTHTAGTYSLSLETLTMQSS